MFDTETSPLNQSQLQEQNKLLMEALLAISDYKNHLPLPIPHYQFKQYALKVANDALAAVKA